MQFGHSAQDGIQRKRQRLTCRSLTCAARNQKSLTCHTCRIWRSALLLDLDLVVAVLQQRRPRTPAGSTAAAWMAHITSWVADQMPL